MGSEITTKGPCSFIVVIIIIIKHYFGVAIIKTLLLFVGTKGNVGSSHLWIFWRQLILSQQLTNRVDCAVD